VYRLLVFFGQIRELFGPIVRSLGSGRIGKGRTISFLLRGLGYIIDSSASEWKLQLPEVIDSRRKLIREREAYLRLVVQPHRQTDPILLCLK